MYTVLSYVFTFFVIVISVLITLFFKNELERMFQKKKDALPFHICNLLITFMVSFAAHAVMAIYVIGDNIIVHFDYHYFFLLLLIVGRKVPYYPCNICGS